MWLVNVLFVLQNFNNRMQNSLKSRIFSPSTEQKQYSIEKEEDPHPVCQMQTSASQAIVTDL